MIKISFLYKDTINYATIKALPWMWLFLNLLYLLSFFISC